MAKINITETSGEPHFAADRLPIPGQRIDAVIRYAGEYENVNGVASSNARYVEFYLLRKTESELIIQWSARPT